MKRNTGQLNKHGIMFSVSVSQCVGSVVAPRRGGSQREEAPAPVVLKGGAIKHNGYASLQRCSDWLAVLKH